MIPCHRNSCNSVFERRGHPKNLATMDEAQTEPDDHLRGVAGAVWPLYGVKHNVV
jgi:hypothetical protein